MFFESKLEIISSLEKLLKNKNCPLEDVLNEDELLEECTLRKGYLLNYLSKKQIVKKLLLYLLDESYTENCTNLDQKIKFPFLANSLIKFGFFGICEIISYEDSLMEIMFNFLDNQAPLNTVYAGYFSNCVQIQFDKRWRDTIMFIDENPEIIDKLLLHYQTSSIKDVVIHIINNCENENYKIRTSKVLLSTKIINKLINLMKNEENNEVHENIKETFVNILTSETPNNTIIEELLNENNIEMLFQCITNSNNSNTRTENTLLILNQILKYMLKNNTTNYQNSLQKVILKHISNIVTLFNNESNKKSILLSFGKLSQPIGKIRLTIIQFFHLTYLNYHQFVEKIYCELEIMGKIIDLFLINQWNSSLHHLVKDMIVDILEGKSNLLINDLLVNNQLINKITEICLQYSPKNKNAKSERGNYSHLLTIANKLGEVASKNEIINQQLSKNKHWANFFENVLQKTIQIQSRILGKENNLFTSQIIDNYELEKIKKNDLDANKKIDQLSNVQNINKYYQKFISKNNNNENKLSFYKDNTKLKKNN
ncbi:sit4 -associating protein-related [Anaeramoeba flamelloides]|uniref:Sit4 -associating protein-related n=1 Tax=Anaeramoeba flamelloides TaxID=1746091 RepID=A0AAV8ABD1_9EUKA|nr:sit4 -associating protein-related [Anaeramoeba flamelloides]